MRGQHFQETEPSLAKRPKVPQGRLILMLDPKFVYENLDAVATAAKQKNIPFNAQTYKDIYEKRRSTLKNILIPHPYSAMP
jgi:hypothetical protein